MVGSCFNRLSDQRAMRCTRASHAQQQLARFTLRNDWETSPKRIAIPGEGTAIHPKNGSQANNDSKGKPNCDAIIVNVLMYRYQTKADLWVSTKRAAIFRRRGDFPAGIVEDQSSAVLDAVVEIERSSTIRRPTRLRKAKASRLVQVALVTLACVHYRLTCNTCVSHSLRAQDSKPP
jgi:hypothetical protein